jgi:hypothetical protein
LLADAKISWGTWGNEKVCSNRRSTIGFGLVFQDICYYCDNTASNSIYLKCDDYSYITSSTGQFGYWKGTQYCSFGSKLIGFRLRSQSDRCYSDDFAATDLQVKCSDGRILSNGGGVNFGLWENWSECSIGHICGITTLVQAYVYGDNTALNSVKFTCCFP